MRNHLKIFAVVFAFLFAGVVGVGNAQAQKAGTGEKQQLVEKCERDGHVYYMSCDQVPEDEPVGGKASTTQSADSGYAPTQPQAQTRFSQEVKPAPKKQWPVAEQKASEATEEEPADAIIAAAEESSTPSPWNTVFVALGIASVVLGSLLIHRHARRQLTDRS